MIQYICILFYKKILISLSIACNKSLYSCQMLLIQSFCLLCILGSLNSALLWHRLMGKGVLAVGSDASPYLRAYAHCSKGRVRLHSDLTLQTNYLLWRVAHYWKIREFCYKKLNFILWSAMGLYMILEINRPNCYG